MKHLFKSIFLLIGITLIHYSCIKVDNTDKRPFTYSIEGIKDVSVPSNYKNSLVLKATVVTGDPVSKYFTISVEGLPPGITVDSAAHKFRLNYSPGFTFYSDNVTEGKYPIQIITKLDSEVVRRDSISIIVASPVSCARWVYGSYRGNTCSVGNMGSIDSVNGQLNRIKIGIQTLMGLGQYPGEKIYLYANIDCANKKFTISPQEAYGDTIRGSGYFTFDTSGKYNYDVVLQVHIDDTLISGGQVVNTCSINMSRSN